MVKDKQKIDKPVIKKIPEKVKEEPKYLTLQDCNKTETINTYSKEINDRNLIKNTKNGFLCIEKVNFISLIK